MWEIWFSAIYLFMWSFNLMFLLSLIYGHGCKELFENNFANYICQIPYYSHGSFSLPLSSIGFELFELLNQNFDSCVNQFVTIQCMRLLYQIILLLNGPRSYAWTIATMDDSQWMWYFYIFI
ncbi:hypothetical protein HS088_TW12G00723 [Tripterygium wilfordii]|uniref:Uncharacterized protein n=1 Tax=Tripterygium wilfordii TaxID=458696 RepID=A0A7J7CZK2_TRIWF|nr:hypothetical protein HS088_TW12G00723 [Tripterygium wilfordii]